MKLFIYIFANCANCVSYNRNTIYICKNKTTNASNYDQTQKHLHAPPYTTHYAKKNEGETQNEKK